ncbi:hypothetical protein EXIGLDRAFT_111967 [Exidia glandulosa HHB12029]|uniref:F-box domain-containing protein n=1 Tax=Exidia glandulosa HHB12029 TaxID=1314781 RepID=A0A165NLM9_EXIGL|nr:hypothetical protein EXIGLDRAFT_111967 [Exidia glandulosa HHB12029]
MDDNGETERDEPYDDDDYFPFAPRLRVLSLWGPNSIVPRTTSPFAQLKTLRLWYQPAFPHAWKLVELVAPTLESLVLAYNDDHLRLLDPSTFVLFPNLTYLGICGATVLMPHLLAMRMPRLSHLCIETEDPPPQWGTFLEGVAQTVTALTLTGYVDMNAAHLFAALDKVERLIFGRFAAEHGEEYIVARSFFETRTMWMTMRLWPRLESVVFTSRGSIKLGTTGTILPFVRCRTTEIEQTDDGERPSKLKECRFELEESKLPPQWMLAEVQRLLNTA